MEKNDISEYYTVIAVIIGGLRMDIAAIVRFHRKKSGLSQAELGYLAGLGKTVIFDIENGKLTIRLETLLKVLHVLNIKIEFKSPLMSLYEKEANEKG